MSLFTEQEELGYVFEATYSSSTRRSTFPTAFATANADFTIMINIIRLGADDSIIYSEEYGDFRANVEDENRMLLKEGQVIRWSADDKLYIITKKPKHLKLFSKTRIYLRDHESGDLANG